MPNSSLLRQQMVEKDLHLRGVNDESVLKAFSAVAREEFVPDDLKDQAYADYPLAIGQGQTISQPYVVALMTQALNPGPTDKILEIGTGSGYQAAILSLLCQKVYTIERIEELAKKAKTRFIQLGFNNIEIRVGDGAKGWPEALSKGSPCKGCFDGIIVTAAAQQVPEALKEQLKIGGRLVIPVGEIDFWQELLVLTKEKDGSFTKENLGLVAFVPLVS